MTSFFQIPCGRPWPRHKSTFAKCRGFRYLRAHISLIYLPGFWWLMFVGKPFAQTTLISSCPLVMMKPSLMSPLTNFSKTAQPACWHFAPGTRTSYSSRGICKKSDLTFIFDGNSELHSDLQLIWEAPALVPGAP